MSKSIALLLVLAFLTASCLIVVKPAFSISAVAAENTWTQKAPMQQARSVLGVAAVNGKIYAIGGSTASGFSLSSNVYGNIDIGGFVGTNEEYDPTTDTWTYKASMPTPRIVFATAVYQNKIYCIGGRSKVGDEGGGYTGLNEVYDPATDTWETKAPMPTARGWLIAGVANGKIYLLGGAPNGVLNEVYDPATDSWTTKASIPTPIMSGFGSVSAVVDNKIYVVGAVVGAPLFVSTLNQIYDPETDSWSQGAPIPSISGIEAAGATSGVLAPKRIYVMHPYNSYGSPSNGVYDPENDSWTVSAATPTSRYNFGVAVVDDTLYVVGGNTFDLPCWFAPVTTNEQYTPFGYGTVPPVLSVASPEHMNYTFSEVQLNFTVNRRVEWMGYSLDGDENVTVTGNSTLTGLKSGLHNVTVYAKDEFGNIGASDTVVFSVVEKPFPFVPVAASAASVALIGVGLLVYFKKRKR